MQKNGRKKEYLVTFKVSQEHFQFSKARRWWLKSACLQALCKTEATLITAATCIPAFFSPIFLPFPSSARIISYSEEH